MDIYPVYIGGEFRKTATPLQVTNPFTKEVFAETYSGNEMDLEEAIIKAIAVEEELKRMPAYRKYKILMEIVDELTVRRQWFTSIISQESAKPWKYAAAEADRAIETFRIAAEESKRLPGEYISIDWTPAGEGKEGLVKYFPVGLVAGIAPFNFPLNLAVHKIAPAIAAGCPIILKPSSLTPIATLELAKILDQSSLPKGAVSIIPMNRNTGNRMVTDDRFKLLSFTGSPEVGWQMKKNAGKKKVVLELGGNAGAIITPTADIDKAVSKCITGGYAYSGQVCIHTQRIFVEQTIFDYFRRTFIDAVKQLKPGDPSSPETDISCMIDTENAIRVEKWIREAVSEGATLLYGGKRDGSFVEPAVMTNTKSHMKVCDMEIFGPVVILEPFNAFEEAVEKVNTGRFGLQAGVFTNNIDEMNYAFLHLNVGGVIVNDVPAFRVDHMPYGGIKDSGLGREGVKYSILEMMEPKVMVKNF